MRINVQSKLMINNICVQVSVKEALGTFCLQNLGILVGIACLYTLARYQDDIAISL